MFHNIDLKTLSELELEVYNYIISHPKEIQNQTIRDLAKTTKVSTATINRFCQKLNLNGFPELKYVIKEELNTEQRAFPSYDISTPLTDFFTKVSRDEFEQQMSAWLALIQQAKLVVYLGSAGSGTLAAYGAQLLRQAGGYAFAQPLTTPAQIQQDRDLHDTLVIALSVSGATEATLVQVAAYKRQQAKIIALTNQEHSPLSQLADLTLTYYLPQQPEPGPVLTTQIPVVYLLETIAQRLSTAITASTYA